MRLPGYKPSLAHAGTSVSRCGSFSTSKGGRTGGDRGASRPSPGSCSSRSWRECAGTTATGARRYVGRRAPRTRSPEVDPRLAVRPRRGRRGAGRWPRSSRHRLFLGRARSRTRCAARRRAPAAASRAAAAASRSLRARGTSETEPVSAASSTPAANCSNSRRDTSPASARPNWATRPERCTSACAVSSVPPSGVGVRRRGRRRRRWRCRRCRSPGRGTGGGGRRDRARRPVRAPRRTA